MYLLVIAYVDFVLKEALKSMLVCVDVHSFAPSFQSNLHEMRIIESSNDRRRIYFDAAQSSAILFSEIFLQGQEGLYFSNAQN